MPLPDRGEGSMDGIAIVVLVVLLVLVILILVLWRA